MNLSMVGIIVKNMEESIAFYQCLGMDVAKRYNDGYVELKHEGVRISLNDLEMITGIYGFTPENKGDKIELAFETLTLEDIDIICDRMKQNNYEIFREPWDAFWGQRYAIIKDPNHNLISLFYNLHT